MRETGRQAEQPRHYHSSRLHALGVCLIACFMLLFAGGARAQGVTTASLSGTITDEEGNPLPGANVVAIHRPSRTIYGVASRTGGQFTIHNMRIGGPYLVRVSFVGYQVQRQDSVYLSLGQNLRLNFQLATQVIEMKAVHVTAEQDEILNSGRTGAATYIHPRQVEQLPSIKRSTRDLFRLDPRSDGNFSFSGRNWLYNNISLDGSYFNNPFGLDDPAPGGQSNAEPLPFEAVEQLQVSIAPYDVRQGGFTGAGINAVTRSGSNHWRGSLYSFFRNEILIGGKVSGDKVLNPNLTFNQSGFTASGAIVRNKLFFFLNGELERRDDPGTNFRAARPGVSGTTVSRVRAEDLQRIRQRMQEAYGYDPGPFEDYVHETNNEKLLLKIDWNVSPFNNVTFRYNRLDARRDLPPHPFDISINNSGRGPNENSLPFRSAGYEMNNELNSYAVEINSREGKFANRFFISYTRFRDFRDPFSKPFPTIEIAVDGITYTTLGHEPFSIHNLLDQDVWQITDNFNINHGKHVLTFGGNLEIFKFNNSSNLFHFGLFPAPAALGASVGGSTFFSLEEFFRLTDPNNPDFRDFNQEIQQQVQKPFKLDQTDVGQLAFYVQDEILTSERFNLTAGLRVDIPLYFTDIPRNELAESLVLKDENGNVEDIDVTQFPSTRPLLSPRVGFNWNVIGNRSTQIRGGTGIFTGRLPFVWLANQTANQGPQAAFPSFDINATTKDFKWPQVWKTNVAIDQTLPWGLLGTLEFLYGNELNNIFVRNANLADPVGVIPGADGRLRYDRGLDQNGRPLNSLNPDVLDAGAGVYILDNTHKGHHVTLTAQLHKRFDLGVDATLAYNFTEAKNRLTSTEIASFLWQLNPISNNPNRPDLSFSEFGNRHRIVGNATYSRRWTNYLTTHFGLFLEIAEGPRFSYVYAGDLNGDGVGGNDLIYVPRNATEIAFEDILDENGSVVQTADQQWTAFDQFIRQDDYLSAHRGQIAKRNGAISPWFSRIDLRILQDFALNFGGQKHKFQLSLDILNVGNLLNSGWGVREVANSGARSPLVFKGNFSDGRPLFQFPGTAQKTFLDDIGLNSRWQMQFGLKYLFN